MSADGQGRTEHDRVGGDVLACQRRELVEGPFVFRFAPSTTTAGLYAPYDAKVIGDYTGLTPPFGFEDSDH